MFILDSMTKSRDPDRIEQLRLGALDALLEMARWKYAGHALPARWLLGRIAGINEGILNELAIAGRVEEIIRKLPSVE